MFQLRNKWFAVLAFLTFAIGIADPAAAARRALLVGIGGYGNGLAELVGPANDIDSLAKVLRKPGLGYDVTTGAELSDRQTFESAVRSFADTVSEDDEVIFYFSGHGFGTTDNGNYFLPKAALGKDMAIKERQKTSPGSLTTDAEKEEAYAEWIADHAVSERFIEETLLARNPRILILLIDACRELVGGGKGVKSASSVGNNRDLTTGVARFYAASQGQASADAATDNKKSKKGGPKTPALSLFTSVLVQYIGRPGIPVHQLAEDVKNEVYRLAQARGRNQLPAFHSLIVNGYYWIARSGDPKLLCSSAGSEVARLFADGRRGALASDALAGAQARFGMCPGVAEQLQRLSDARLYGHGTAFLGAPGSTTTLEVFSPTGDAERDCDQLASSPFDPNRPQDVETRTELIDWALQGYSTTNLDDQEIAAKQIDLAISLCQEAIKNRPKVARFRFNLGNGYYAKATIGSGEERSKLLGRAYESYRDAADLSYMAAFNNMAVLIEARETGDEKLGVRQTNEKSLAALQQGAELGHVIAMHNLGIRYRDGLLGLEVNYSKAYAWLSKAADAGYVPAMVAAGRLLLEQRGLLEQPNAKRALSLIERAARRGSDEAMEWLGYYYQVGAEYTPSDGQTDTQKKSKKQKAVPIILVAQDPARSLIWYSRAAELGNTYAQERLAFLLTNGQGLPAPQPQAAGRYWRLASQGGSAYAQVTLANLLKKGSVPLRPSVGAAEIALLYREAAERGNPEAALRMAQLHQDGYRVLGNVIVTQDAGEAVRYASRAVELQHAAGSSTWDGDPRVAIEAAMIVQKLAPDRPKLADGSEAISQARIDELKAEYGDLSKAKSFNLTAYRADDPEAFCGWPPYFNFYVWDWEKEEPPTTMQFDWFERFNPDCQITEGSRKQILGQFNQARKEKKPFSEVLATYISKQEGNEQNQSSDAN